LFPVKHYGKWRAGAIPDGRPGAADGHRIVRIVVTFQDYSTGKRQLVFVIKALSGAIRRHTVRP
jgi:hypothetical protein